MSFKRFSCLSYNINSLRGKFDDVVSTVSTFSPDVVFLQETKLDVTITQSFDIPNYVLFRSDRNANGGGLATYVKLVHSPSFVDIDLFESTGEFLCVRFNFSGHVIVSCNSYKAPSLSNDDYCSSLTNVSSILSTLSNNILLAGDFNICHLSSESSGIINSLYPFDLVPLVDFPTHKLRCIDVVYISKSLYSSCSVNSLSPIEKFHLGIIVYIYFKIDFISSKPSPSTFLDYANANWLGVSDYLCSLNIVNTISASVSVDHCVEVINNSISDAVNLFVPVVVSKPYRSWPPYFNRELKNLIITKNSLHRRFLSTNNPSYFIRYKRIRSVIRKKIRSAKCSFIDNNINNCSNPRKLWKTVNGFLSKNNSVISSVIDDSPSCNVVSDSSSMAYLFAKFFSSLNNDSTFDFPDTSNLDRDFALPYCDVPFVTNHISRLRVNVSPGVDCVSAIFLKRCSLVMSPIICSLINKVIHLGLFPTQYKHAIVTVIPKSPNPTHLSHYRPISLLPIISKIIEHYLLAVLQFHTLHLISPYQFGFLKGRGTLDCVYSVINNAYNILNSFPNACMISLDVSKAFDKVLHNKLFDILVSFNIPFQLFRIVSSFLSNRTQSVRINNCISTPFPIRSGVPQGSVIGPYLFLLYFNNIFSFSNKSVSLYGYADDLLLLSPFSNNDHVICVQSVLNNINSFLSNSLFLSLNASKSNLLILKRPRGNISLPPQVTINGAFIPVVSHLLYLGVHFDDTLSFSTHTIIKCSLIKRHVAACISIFRKSLTFSRKILIYKVLIRCHLYYCLESTYPSNISDRIRLEKVQKFALRYISNMWSRDINYSTLLQLCNVPPFWFSVAVNRLFLLHSYVTGARHSPEGLFTFDCNVRRSMRNYNFRKLTVPFSKFHFFLNSPLISTINVYNRIPNNLISLHPNNLRRKLSDTKLFNSIIFSSDLICSQFDF